MNDLSYFLGRCLYFTVSLNCRFFPFPCTGETEMNWVKPFTWFNMAAISLYCQSNMATVRSLDKSILFNVLKYGAHFFVLPIHNMALVASTHSFVWMIAASSLFIEPNRATAFSAVLFFHILMSPFCLFSLLHQYTGSDVTASHFMRLKQCLKHNYNESMTHRQQLVLCWGKRLLLNCFFN